MTGDCGAFYVGDKQIGGCHEWELSMKMDSSARDGWKTHRVLNSKATIKRWWFYENVREFVIKLYWFRSDRLVPAGEYKIKSLPKMKDTPLGEIINGKLILTI